jgi:hypothetical protein
MGFTAVGDPSEIDMVFDSFDADRSGKLAYTELSPIGTLTPSDPHPMGPHLVVRAHPMGPHRGRQARLHRAE